MMRIRPSRRTYRMFVALRSDRWPWPLQRAGLALYDSAWWLWDQAVSLGLSSNDWYL